MVQVQVHAQVQVHFLDKCYNNFFDFDDKWVNTNQASKR